MLCLALQTELAPFNATRKPVSPQTDGFNVFWSLFEGPKSPDSKLIHCSSVRVGTTRSWRARRQCGPIWTPQLVCVDPSPYILFLCFSFLLLFGTIQLNAPPLRVVRLQNCWHHFLSYFSGVFLVFTSSTTCHVSCLVKLCTSPWKAPFMS